MGSVDNTVVDHSIVNVLGEVDDSKMDEILYINYGMLSTGVLVRQLNWEPNDMVVVVGASVCVVALFIMLSCCIINVWMD